MRGLAVVKRFDQRLDDRDRAVVGTRVAPRFEKMRGGNMPVTQLRRFILVLAEMNAKSGFVETVEIELEIDRRVVDRIATHHDEELDTSSIEIVNEIL